MKLLRELMRVQEELGYLDEDTLKDISQKWRVPLYHLEGLVSFYPHFRREPAAPIQIHFCRDVCCHMAVDEDQLSKLRSALADRDDVLIEEASCLGRCDSAPAAMLNETPLAPNTLDDLLSNLSDLNAFHARLHDEPTTTPRSWKCDPYQTADERYRTVKGLATSLESLQTRCLQELGESGLRGMGGAGFPTARKWQFVADQKASQKYVICNADESEPSTFKDRVILEELPHLVIEGMLLAALTVGADRGIVFLRHEYTREKIALERAIQTAYDEGLLGENAAGSGKNFDLEVFISPGGYILGEETALLEALEDKRGEPRNKPPYPGTHGLWGKPTLINNVETFALATSIIHHGAKWWHEQGVGDFSGLKVVSVSGDVREPGVFEISVGTPVSDVIQQAGGMIDDRTLLAFLPGGASSHFLKAEHADVPFEFDSLKAAGSMLGTGALIVIAEGRDLYALATNLVSFFRNESCGKCVPCRIGSQEAVTQLETHAESRESLDTDGLVQLGETLEQTSICGLGQVALGPILSLLKQFPELVSGTIDV